MPGIVKVKVIEGRNLPVMDRSADTTDAYVELKLGNITYKSDVYRKSLNPLWNTEWYKFEMADADLQDEPLQVRVMDYDTYSANDLIGKVYFNLNPLLLNSTNEFRSILKSDIATIPGAGCISGWFPIYDTLLGLRGEISLIIKLELFSDFNKFRQSSCGVHIFSCNAVPQGYYTENIFGFVEELVVEDDPEYQWIEKIRSPRASNEARQAIFYKMSGILQRKIGMKVVEMGGNAIIGYRQCFDLEGETGGVVVRGIGTAVKLNKHKKLENIIIRNSFCENFNIPYVTLTSAFNFDNQIHSDICSVFSLTDSLQSDRCLSDFIPDDRWSLCSFASRTSSASRYTSVETLLDQTNRKPVVKSGSKLLNVARYFTSSKLRRKFSQKKKHKSILLRKFSVIEEYKQKGGGSLGAELDEMVQESTNEFPRKNSSKLDRVPTVEEETSCIFFDKSQSNRSVYFNLSGFSNFDGIKIGGDDVKRNNSATEIRKMEATDFEPETTNETRELSFIGELNKCIIADDQFEASVSKVDEGLSSDEGEKQEDLNPDDEIEQIFASIPKKLELHLGDRQPIGSSTLSSETSCSTPPISEMIPYCMSPPPSNAMPVKAVVPPRGRQNLKTIQFERNFLKTLRRKDVGDYFSISNSPEIRRLGVLNEERKRNLKSSSEICVSTGSFKKCEISGEHSSSTNVLCTSNLVDAAPRESDDKFNSSGAENFLISKMTCDDENREFNTLSETYANLSNSLDEFSRAYYSNDDSNYIDTNKTNCNVRVTTADDNCNLLREALTPSRLLMHANNPDRNISEGDKEDYTTKREGVIAAEYDIKNRSSSDAGMLTRCHDFNKETSGEKDQPNAADVRGRNVLHRENFELMEYPFLTLTAFPEEFIIHLGGTVSARSVKLLDRISNPEEPETRDVWWTELRIEIKSHMRALACNVVLNYTETTSICEEICLLSAIGTAALVKIYDNTNAKVIDDSEKPQSAVNMNTTEQETKSVKLNHEDSLPPNCSVFHIPYRKSSLPFPVNIKTCELCKKGFVADVTFVTIEPLVRMPVVGQSTFIHAFVCRPKRDCKSELNAREVSEGLPFLEYELNRQLINKLRIKGMNAIFGLNVNVSVGEKMIAAYATGTAMLLSALPPPPELTLAAHSRTFTLHPTSRKKLNELCKMVEDSIKQNKIHYQLIEHRLISDVMAKTNVQNTSCDIAIQDQYPDMEYFANSKHTCVIEVDDEHDLEAIAQLIDTNPPQGFFVSATEEISFGSLPYVPKKNIQLFAQVYRYRIPSNTPPGYFNKCFHRIVQALYMKIHHRIPCSLNKVSFKINIPDSDEIQIRIVGMALALREPERLMGSVSTSCSSVSELADDVILSIENERDTDKDSLSSLTSVKQSSKKREKRTGVFENEVHVTSLSYIPGANINFYLGNLNFVFIRESAMVKEQPGGANNFVSNFLSDVITVVKSHAVGIGGNAVVNFFLSECLLTTHSHKNQGQCLTHVGGDVVRYVYKTT